MRASRTHTVRYLEAKRVQSTRDDYNIERQTYFGARCSLYTDMEVTVHTHTYIMKPPPQVSESGYPAARSKKLQWLWEIRLAVENGGSNIPWPGNELLQKVIELFDRLDAFERLYKREGFCW